MARRKVEFLPGYYYHVYNRGVGRQPIFHTEDNYTFLLRRVKTHVDRLSISVITHCLMPNHYHFLLRQDGEQTISDLMQAIFNSYTKAINRRFHRTGTLFEGPFQAIQVDREKHLIHLCRYIHRNPLEAALVSHPGEWPFSNYLEWVGQRSGSLVDREFVRAWFPTPADYERFVMDYEPPPAIAQAIQRLALEQVRRTWR